MVLHSLILILLLIRVLSNMAIPLIDSHRKVKQWLKQDKYLLWGSVGGYCGWFLLVILLGFPQSVAGIDCNDVTDPSCNLESLSGGRNLASGHRPAGVPSAAPTIQTYEERIRDLQVELYELQIRREKSDIEYDQRYKLLNNVNQAIGTIRNLGGQF